MNQLYQKLRIKLNSFLPVKYLELEPEDLLSPVMIDRIHFTMCIGKHKPIAETFLLELDIYGEMVSNKTKSVTLNAENSNEQGCMIRSVKEDTIEVITSPNKFLYGHNIYGSSDMQLLITKTVHRAVTMLERTDLIEHINLQTVELLSVDINSMLSIPDVQQYLNLLPSRLLTAQTIERTGNTVYVGNRKHGDYAYRIYDKLVERKAKNQYDKLTPTEGSFTYDKIRIELILNKRELQSLQMYSPSSWTICKTEEIYRTYLLKLRIMKNRNEDLSKLSHQAAGYYARWKFFGDSADVIIPDKKTRIKYRKEILEQLGYDIYKPYSEEQNAPPLHLLLEPKELPMNGVDRQETAVTLHRISNTLQHVNAKGVHEAINSIFLRPRSNFLRG